MPEVKNAALLACEVAVYFVFMASLFRFRRWLGIGTFFCALGALHFLETYLASAVYIALPGGIVASPGSTALFAGKLLMLLLVYIREDAATVRQPIYGLLIGNFMMIGLVLILRQHEIVALASDRAPDFALMDEMGLLMAWGTLLLFVDGILIILLYERSKIWFGGHTTLRIWVSAAAVLTFDQAGFFAGLHLLVGADSTVLIGGWATKMATAIVYAVLIGCYLRWFEARPDAAPRRVSDVFDTLTYRERYEILLAQSGRDGLTGLLDRGRFETQAGSVVAKAALQGRPVSVIVADIDHFKSINDDLGHVAGDAVLRQIAQTMADLMRGPDLLFRYGGEEFVAVCEDLNHDFALILGERIRRSIAAALPAGAGHTVTISIGIATGSEDGADLISLFKCADARLYAAKSGGRNRVVGRPQEMRGSVELLHAERRRLKPAS